MGSRRIGRPPSGRSADVDVAGRSRRASGAGIPPSVKAVIGKRVISYGETDACRDQARQDLSVNVFPDEGACGGYQAQESDHIGNNAWRNKQRSGDEDDDAVRNFFSGHRSSRQLGLKTPPDGKTLGFRQIRAQDTCHQDNPESFGRADGFAEPDEQVKLQGRQDDENGDEATQHLSIFLWIPIMHGPTREGTYCCNC